MKTAYLFPGQGSQHVGMGRDLYQREPAARAVFDLADDLLGFSLSSLCFQGPEEMLTDTVNQQPALFTTSLAAWSVIRERAAWPAADFVLGHSMGELSALAAAGTLTFADGLALVRRRGEHMKAAGEREPGAMAAILGLDTAAVESACVAAGEQSGRPVQIANDNCPGQVVISGDRVALQAAMREATAAGARKVMLLPITIAAHSPLMASAAQAFARDIAATPISAPTVLILANLTAEPMSAADEIRTELSGQLTGGVQWTNSILYLREQGVENFFEVGPGDVLTKLMRRIDRKANRRRFTETD